MERPNKRPRINNSSSSSSSSSTAETTDSTTNHIDEDPTPTTSKLSEYDRRIAELEAELWPCFVLSDSDSNSDSDSDSSSEDSEDNSNNVILTSLKDEDRIVPLASHLLPESYAKSATSSKKKKKKKPKKPRSSGTKEDVSLELPRDPNSLVEKARNHSNRDKSFWKSAREEAMKAYEPHHNKKLYCRLCKLDFSNESELFEHRSTRGHKEQKDLERKLTYCKICRKQFTSVNQLGDHVKGRSHIERLTTLQRSGSGRGRGNRGRGRGGGTRGRGGGNRGGGNRGRGRGRGRGRDRDRF